MLTPYFSDPKFFTEKSDWVPCTFKVIPLQGGKINRTGTFQKYPEYLNRKMSEKHIGQARFKRKYTGQARFKNTLSI